MRNKHVWESAALDVDTTGDKATFYAHTGICVEKVVVICTSTDAGGGTVAFDTVTSGGTRGAADAGEITIPASDQQYNALTQNVDSVYVEAGGRVVVQVTADPGAGPAFIAKIVYSISDEQVANSDGAASA